MKTIGFIGTGKMASALIAGMLNKRLMRPSSIIGTDRSPRSLAMAKKSFRIRTVKDNPSLVKRSDIIFLAVKPKDIPNVMQEIREEAVGKLIVSIAAGITLRQLENGLGTRVIRVMPNTPCLVGEMASAYSLGKKASKKDGDLIRKILSANGLAIEMPEKKLDAVTALSGSGPAYFATFIDELVKSGIRLGLSSKESQSLAIQTCLGTGKLLRDKEMAPQELITMVCSKKGTTEAGLNALKGTGFKAAVRRMVTAAYRRSKELGRNA